LELIISFIFAFTMTCFFVRDIGLVESKKRCPNKESILRLAEGTTCHNKITKELKEYSLVKIQEGYFEYGEVLNTLTKKDRNDKS
jgi:hypothetical protein